MYRLRHRSGERSGEGDDWESAGALVESMAGRREGRVKIGLWKLSSN